MIECTRNPAQDSKTERIKVSYLEIIVTMIGKKPYYEIKYKEIGEDYYHVGYSSYKLENVLTWRDECFEVVRETQSNAGWIPCSERLPEKCGTYLVAWKPCDMSEEDIIKKCGSPHYYESLECDPDDETVWIETIEQAEGEYVILAWMPLPEPYSAEAEKPQTNADRIRSMTDEELLDFLCSIETYDQGSVKTIEGGIAMCSVTEVEQWLKTESEE